MAGILRTDQIVRLRSYLAGRQGQPVAARAGVRVTQRRLQQLVRAGILRRIEQPIYPGQRTGAKPYLYALARSGAELVAQQLGVDVREIEWKPRDAERNLLFTEHTLAVADFRLALQQACLDHGVTMAEWTGEAILRREPARVEILIKDNQSLTVTLVPDGYARLVLPSSHAAWIFLEIDRGTVTVEPSQWQLRSWRRKVLAYRQLQGSGILKEHFGAESMIVATVTTGPKRLQNLRRVCERAGGDHRFWFTTFGELAAETILTGPIWSVAGLGKQRQRLLPDEGLREATHEPPGRA
ncbi:MAG: replication-relaxation family protein [Caldilineaceae bacterium]|nr:replication-relaxation family protein [Caldilineaceae bacterium]